MMAAMMPAFALAETNSNSAPASVEANDTTIRVNDQNIVIKQDGEQTSVKIYKMNGNEMTKISETQFVDGQEVEKLYQLQCTPPAYHAGVEEAHRMP